MCTKLTRTQIMYNCILVYITYTHPNHVQLHLCVHNIHAPKSRTTAFLCTLLTPTQITYNCNYVYRTYTHPNHVQLHFSVHNLHPPKSRCRGPSQLWRSPIWIQGWRGRLLATIEEHKNARVTSMVGVCIFIPCFISA